MSKVPTKWYEVMGAVVALIAMYVLLLIFSAVPFIIAGYVLLKIFGDL